MHLQVLLRFDLREEFCILLSASAFSLCQFVSVEIHEDCAVSYSSDGCGYSFFDTTLKLEKR